MPYHLTHDEARARLVSWFALAQPELPPGAEGVVALLDRLRHIQLDPLDPIGTNADLVALARVDGIARGDVYRHLGPDATGASRSFEQFAKVRCILPASFFPWYRDHMPGVGWWSRNRAERLPEGALEAVREQVASRGPVAAQDLDDLGRVPQLDWSGWKGTGKAATLALEVLWSRCEVVVSGKDAQARRLHDLPSRAFPEHAHRPATAWGPWALAQRVAAAGLLGRNMGPTWTTLRAQREDGTIPELLARGELVEVALEGARRPYLASPDFLTRPVAPPDDRLRILGPLDPLLWDRKLVQMLFGFDYAWEVYKPAKTRSFGWYVVPLLHRGALIGRLEARVQGDKLMISGLWWEEGVTPPKEALLLALERHATACGARSLRWGRGLRPR